MPYLGNTEQDANVLPLSSSTVHTCTALDTQIIVIGMRLFLSSGDRSCRAVSCTLAAADTKFRIDDKFTQC